MFIIIKNNQKVTEAIIWDRLLYNIRQFIHYTFDNISYFETFEK